MGTPGMKIRPQYTRTSHNCTKREEKERNRNWLNIYCAPNTSNHIYHGQCGLTTRKNLESSGRWPPGHACGRLFWLHVLLWEDPLWMFAGLFSGQSVLDYTKWRKHAEHQRALISLLPDCGCDATSCFKQLLPWRPHHDEPSLRTESEIKLCLPKVAAVRVFHDSNREEN